MQRRAAMAVAAMTAIIGTTGVVTVSAVTGAQLFGFHLGQAAAKDAVGADPTSSSAAKAASSSSDDPPSSDAQTSLDPVYVHVKQYYNEVVQVSTEAPAAAAPTRAVAAAAKGTSTWAATNPATTKVTVKTTTPSTKATPAPTQPPAAPTAAPTTTRAPRPTTTAGQGYDFNAWRAAHPGANLGNWPQMHPTQAPPAYPCGARGGQLEDNGVWNCQ